MTPPLKQMGGVRDVLFEIGTEELPATSLADIFESSENILETRLRKILEEKRISFQALKIFATPRRLVYHLTGVRETQESKDLFVKIMPKQEAYASDGSPTEKFLMILKHKNARPEETVVQEQGGREQVFIKKAEEIRRTEAVLPEIFEALIKSPAFPKNMKWDDSGIIFPRPIRSLLCIYGKKTLRFKIGNLKTSGETLIFSRSKRTSHPVKDIPAYFDLLKKNGIVLDPRERKKEIGAQLERLAKTAGAELYHDPFLLSEVNFLVERPSALAAPFGREFLTLPPEVLAVSMARKQRIFGVVGKDGQLLPKFFAVLDGAAGAGQRKSISSNMEGILHAKLKDSLFFYKEDTKLPLEKKRDELKNLIFLKDAGSMLQKSERLVRLAKALRASLALPDEDAKALERACFLSKCDLLSQMVGEFPELQGVVGKYYALESGESTKTARAIGEQYLPRTVHDRLPETLAGSLLSVFDKADLIAACFRLGLEPTSSLDPYGLRRSATAILKILLDKNLPLSLVDLLNSDLQELGLSGDKDKETLGKLKVFFKDRFRALLVDRGFREDLVEAVMAPGFEFPCRTHEKVKLLAPILEESFFPKAWKVVERTVNILKGNKEILPERIDPSVFTEDLERRVHEHYERSRQGVLKAAQSSDLKLATSLYAEAFFDILGEFFEKVFVNAEDPKVRKNRLALLKAVRDLYTENIADLSKIRQS